MTTIIECDGPCERRTREDESALGWLTVERLNEVRSRSDEPGPWHFCGGVCLRAWSVAVMEWLP